MQVAGDAIEAAEDMFGSPMEDLNGAGGAKGEGKGDGKEKNDMAPLPVDLVCNGVWRPVQQVIQRDRSFYSKKVNFSLALSIVP